MSANSDRRWSLARATEFFSGDGKPDMLDIRGMTAVTKGAAGKRDKFRKSVSRCGVSIYGPKHSAASAGDSANREKIFIEDPRAPCLNIDYSNDAYRLLPSSEKFSAHTGVGDIIRFGSVGLLVTEIDTGGVGPNDATLSPSEVNSLIQRVVCHDEALADVDSGMDTDDENGDASGNDESKPRSSLQRQSTSAICYVCYDETEDDNPLIAPCKCSGDTKYIHLNCLKRWNTNGEKNEICTVLDESNARTCSICKAPYPSKTRLPNGKTKPAVYHVPSRDEALVIDVELVTRYQLSYKMLMDNDIHRPLMSDVVPVRPVLKYRTVSTIHAEIHYSKGEFFLKDAGSSNGTLRYIYRPLTLHNKPVAACQPTKKIRLPHFFGTAGHLHASGSRMEDSGVQDDDELSNNSTPRNNRIRYYAAQQQVPTQQQQPRQNLQTQMQNLDL
ncbi:Zinc finger, RING/FYVE/PHD-type [Phytophthora cactorum]|nr:Zinc finger, RING/FYVE/PHD-type [Phytophthora cactorum]